MNILIDDLPTDYEGYLINYTYKSGILISECLASDEFEDTEEGEVERVFTAFRILYGKGIPPYDVAIKGLKWFLGGGEIKEETNKPRREAIFSFSEDKNRIYSAFKLRYGINLRETNMHFFEFLTLFNDLDKTSFRRVVDLRSMKDKDLKRYSREDRQEILRLKREFALNKNIKEKELRLTKFDKLLQEIKGA